MKGKGEPSYTIERDQKERQARAQKHSTHNSTDGMDFEMQPGVNSHVNGTHSKGPGVQVRQRSVSNVADSSSRPSPASPTSPTPTANGFSTTSEIRRSNTTGKRISDGLKRRFGSLRKKKTPEGE